MPTIAIYPRKSKYTGKGESVQTQIELCREYCDTHFENPAYVVYGEDEGFSGGNIERPSFRRMMEDARARKFDVLCCYRLDRISRNVSDFSKTLDELQGLGIAFVSLREQFDTSSPMGRAMIYISSVFAQLERDTLTERINDNLHTLAKEGRWLGGTTPTGYRSQRIQFERGGKARYLQTLVEHELEMETIRFLYSTFLEKGTIGGTVTASLQNYVKTRTGKDFSQVVVKGILQNPVYCIADHDAWEYFSQGDFNLCAEEADFDGTHGIQPFSRTASATSGRSPQKQKPTSEWIIAVGSHKGEISGADWVRVQSMIGRNKGWGYGAPRTENALLSGLLVCGSCGSFMRPKTHSKVRADGTRGASYICTMKLNSRGQRCNMKNVDAHDVDDAVLQRLTDLQNGSFSEASAIDIANAESRRSDYLAQLERAKQTEQELKQKQHALVTRLADLTLPQALIKAISDEFEKTEQELNDLKSTIADLGQKAASCDVSVDILSMMRSLMSNFSQSFDTLSFDEKRHIFRTVIERVIWDGSSITLELFGERTHRK